MAGLSMEIRVERRPAMLRSHPFRKDEERVLVWPTCSREHAFCEHEDGTVTGEQWAGVRFLDTDFSQWHWEGEE